MRQITLRDIPDDVELVVRNEAENNHISLNKAFLSVLRRGARQNVVPERRRMGINSAGSAGAGTGAELEFAIAELKRFADGQTAGDMTVATMIAEGRR